MTSRRSTLACRSWSAEPHGRNRPANASRAPASAAPPDATNPYVVGVKSRFVTLIGGTLPSPDPFTESLVPEVTKYCK